MNAPLSLLPPVQQPVPVGPAWSQGAAVPYASTPFVPNVSEAPGSAQRLDELRDLLAAFCLLEAAKFYETSKSTPANVANLRELARVAQVVLAIDPKPGAGSVSDAPFDYSILSDVEAEHFRQLREKAQRSGGRAA
jgi:hypothetical protein